MNYRTIYTQTRMSHQEVQPPKVYAYGIADSQTKRIKQYITVPEIVARKTNTISVTSHNLIL